MSYSKFYLPHFELNFCGTFGFEVSWNIIHTKQYQPSRSNIALGRKQGFFLWEVIMCNIGTGNWRTPNNINGLFLMLKGLQINCQCWQMLSTLMLNQRYRAGYCLGHGEKGVGLHCVHIIRDIECLHPGIQCQSRGILDKTKRISI